MTVETQQMLAMRQWAIDEQRRLLDQRAKAIEEKDFLRYGVLTESLNAYIAVVEKGEELARGTPPPIVDTTDTVAISTELEEILNRVMENLRTVSDTIESLHGNVVAVGCEVARQQSLLDALCVWLEAVVGTEPLFTEESGRYNVAARAAFYAAIQSYKSGQ